MTKQWLRKSRKTVALLLALILLLPFNLVDYAFAGKAPKASNKEIIAEWNFKNKGENGVFTATGGSYQTASLLENVGGTFENYDSGNKEISYQGWDGGKGLKYWLAAVSTKGFKNIVLSSQHNSSGSGPNDFKVQISADNQVTWSDVPNGSVRMNTSSSYDCPENKCKLNQLPLPKADNKDLLYIRWIVSSDKATNMEDNPSGIGDGGSSRIRDVRVSGDRIAGTALVVPTIDLVHLPKNGAEKAAASAPLTVKFNKKVKLDSKFAVTIMDDKNKALTGVSSEIVKDTLRINHPVFTYGKSYKVSIPKGLISGEDKVKLTRNISWSFTVQDSPTEPKMMNMTFNGDPKTSLAFAWYTDVATATQLQVVEASKVQGGVFPEQEAVKFTGTGEEISTFMTPNDRETGNKSKFISHKVIAERLSPGTKYNFRVGNGKEWGQVGSFTTDTVDNQPYHFIAGSDSQASSKEEFKPWEDTFRKAVEQIGEPKFLINAGDLVDHGDLEEQWQWMLGLAQEQLLNVPFVPVLGGHEILDWDGDETTSNNNFYNHFNLPRKVVDATYDGSVYSFEYGDALYMVYNSQFDGKLNKDGTINWDDDQHEQFWNQVAWMKNTVAKSDKKWKFVAFHKSPYAAGDNSAQWEGDRIDFYKNNLIPVFDELGIDMVFEAHDHMYMRSFQMHGDQVIDPKDLKKDDQDNVIDPKGTIYLMSNAFGNKFYYKNNQFVLDENFEPQEVLDKDGKPIPYDDYFAAINEQPEKKMFTDVSVSDQVLKFDAYTAAVEDEGKAGFGEDGLKVYDHYGIKRTDTNPEKVEQVKVELDGNKATLTWRAPLNSKEPVRGFRIYEKNDKVGKHWSQYVPVKTGTTEYSITIENINPDIKYDLIVKAVGRRDNSAPVEVSTRAEAKVNEPLSAPTHLQGAQLSRVQAGLSWTASSGKAAPSGYNIYRNGNKVGTSVEATYQDTGLEPSTEYRYTVKAMNAGGIESLASNEVSVKTNRSVAGKVALKAFPQHIAYTEGTIKPNHITQAKLDATVARLYDEWKKKYVKKHPYLKASDPAQYYIWYADGDWFEKEHDEKLKVDYMATTVSEAHGYGMLITALMAGHDRDAKKIFDGMYRYFKAHPSEINAQLMAWKQGDTGKAIIDVEGVDSATDGDLDIAYSLLLADSQWGSGGEINYLAEAKKVINAIMQSDVNHTLWTLKLADWADDNDPKYGIATRPSDFMLQHMKDFRNVTGDANWDKVIDQTYGIVNGIYRNNSPKSGLLPDFVIKSNGKFIPAGKGFLESDFDGDYSYNSSRTPWRIGTDYLLTGDIRAKDQLSTLNRWIRNLTKGNPSKIRAGYKLDGSKALEDYEDLTFSAPLMVSAMIDSSNQQWLNKLWDYNAAISTKDDLYFGNNLRLLSMIVVSGNWWTPTVHDAN
ncbi:glycosyl hydrolase family 8 [Cohnella sp. WQ 127256]|uniref:glycosyl hydrolase family 8 n=1 Tax=Cohnella sp. WQ 127256 TaxID=2938790 RepID=UPI0021180EB1|nr:glycosyl hydrolase family 8 [Cohnella sp. WQ 127256]